MFYKIKAKLQAIALKQGYTFSEQPNKLLLNIPEGEGIVIMLSFHNTKDRPICTTLYKAKGQEFRFDRYGADVSFYYEGLRTLPKQIEEQRERVKDSQAHLALIESFDLGPIRLMLAPQAIKAIVKKLQAGKTHTYHPKSGFGTGYYFSTIPKVGMSVDTITASAALETLVGQKVYVSQFAAD